MPSEECRRSWLYSSIQTGMTARASALVAKWCSRRSSNSTVECQLSVAAQYELEAFVGDLRRVLGVVQADEEGLDNSGG